VLLDARRLGEQERLQRPPLHLLALHKLRHRPAAHQRHVAPKQHAIKTRQHATDRLLMLGDKGIHGGDRTAATSAAQAAAPRATSPVPQ